MFKNKKCSKCQKEKPLESFSIDKQKSDRLTSRCKDCQSKWYAKLRKTNPKGYERRLAENKRWKQSEKGKEYMKEYMKVYSKSSKYKESRKMWYENHPEKVIEYSRNNYKRNKEKINRKKKELTLTLKKELMKLLGGIICVKCGYSDIRALQFDHIHGDGAKDKLRSHMLEFCKYYLKNPKITKKKLQVLCANCNWVKRWEELENN